MLKWTTAGGLHLVTSVCNNKVVQCSKKCQTVFLIWTWGHLKGGSWRRMVVPLVVWHNFQQQRLACLCPDDIRPVARNVFSAPATHVLQECFQLHWIFAPFLFIRVQKHVCTSSRWHVECISQRGCFDEKEKKEGKNGLKSMTSLKSLESPNLHILTPLQIFVTKNSEDIQRLGPGKNVRRPRESAQAPSPTNQATHTTSVVPRTEIVSPGISNECIL